MASQDYVVYPYQSFIDIAIQEHGTAFAAVEIAIANEKNITDELAPGLKLKKTNATLSNGQLANYFKGRKITIATGKLEDIDYNEYGFPEGEFPISL